MNNCVNQIISKKNVLVVGSGQSGFWASKLAVSKGYNVYLTSTTLIEEKKKNQLLHLGVKIEEGQNSTNYLQLIDFIIKSPGVPNEIEFLQNAKNESITIISEIEFAFHFTDAILIAITGTNGKTTTASLVFHMLKSAGLDVDLVGNIGRSFSEGVLTKKSDYYVLELSSFQLDDIISFKPNVAVLLNITPDHLDRYNNDFTKYIKSKLRITLNQSDKDDFIYFLHDEHIINHLSNIKAHQHSFGTKPNSIQLGAWLDNNKIIINTSKNQFTMTIHNLALQGTHNLYNSMAASIVASRLGIRKEIIKESLSNFKGIEHRLEFVTEISGIKFINDSKATNCNSVYYALESITTPIIWICGGVDKGNDYSILQDLVSNKVRSIIHLGKNSNKIQKSFSHDVEDIINVDNMSDAVNYSYRLASNGDTVLLSPACSSFDLFKDYEERGQVFKSCVLSI